jgi:hypothetical protein
VAAVFISVILIFIHGNGAAYVMPSEQLLEFMLKNFSGIKTLVIIQSTLHETTVEGENVQNRFKEQLWLKSPGFFESRPFELEGFKPDVRPMGYRRIIMASGLEDTETYLRNLGIDLGQVSFTRLEGKIAYLIGQKDSASPKLLVEKDRFVPLQLIYPSSETPGKMASVRFKDFRQLGKGWYPFTIIYSIEDVFKETLMIQSYEVNVPVNASIFSTEKEGPASSNQGQTEKTESDDERLRKILKTFEEKYR